MNLMLPQYVIEYIGINKKITRYHNDVKRGHVYMLASDNVSIPDAMIYIGHAIAMQARYIILNKNVYQKIIHQCNTSETTILAVENTRLAWAIAVSCIYNELPTNITTVTGTNGKTSVAYLYSQIASIIKSRAGYIGTLGAIEICNNKKKKVEETLTTPDAMDLQRILASFHERNFQHVCIEASSHGIDQYRVSMIPFTAAAFTNLSAEHMDYHINMEQYYTAKAKLFTDVLGKDTTAVLNIDDKYGRRLVNDIRALNKKLNIITYGKSNATTIQLLHFKQNAFCDIKYNNQKMNVKCNIIGEYNIYNLLCAYGLLISSGFDINEIVEATKHVELPAGRMTRVCNSPDIYVDFAHKPEALRHTLNALLEYKHEHSKGKILIVFGCGGDRDKSKRPIMGQIAAELTDVVIVTDDNPRHEIPSEIRRQIIDKISNYIEIPDRKNAIEYVMQHMSINDMLLIAGKGHEQYQIVGSNKTDFCDIKTAILAVEKFFQNADTLGNYIL